MTEAEIRLQLEEADVDDDDLDPLEVDDVEEDDNVQEEYYVEHEGELLRVEVEDAIPPPPVEPVSPPPPPRHIIQLFTFNQFFCLNCILDKNFICRTIFVSLFT